jgi:hypothetical protein
MRTSFRLIGFLLALQTVKADQIVLPDPEYYESLTIGNPFSNSNSYTFQGFTLGNFQAPCSSAPGAPICGQISLTTTPDASVTASISAYAGQLSSVIAEVAYYYEIIVPGAPAQSNTPGTTLIPLVVSGYASFTSSLGPNTTIGGTLQNSVGIVVAGQGPNGGTVANRAGSSPSAGPSPFLVYANAYAYTPNAISLQAFGTVYNNGDATPGTVSLFVDPVVSFAPGFDSTGYSIVVSSGVANGPDSTGAPEPTSFTLAGFALAGLVLRYRRIGCAGRPAESAPQPGMRKT